MSVRDEYSKDVVEIVKSRTANFLSDLPGKVDFLLRQAVLDLLGFDQSFGRIQIRDDSRRSLIIQHITATTQDRIKSNIDSLVVDVIDSIHNEPKLRSAVIKKAADSYYSYLDRALREELEKKAKADAATYVKSMINPLMHPLIENTDLEDPNSFDGELGEIILKGLAEREIAPLIQ